MMFEFPRVLSGIEPVASARITLRTQVDVGPAGTGSGGPKMQRGSGLHSPAAPTAQSFVGGARDVGAGAALGGVRPEGAVGADQVSAPAVVVAAGGAGAGVRGEVERVAGAGADAEDGVGAVGVGVGGRGGVAAAADVEAAQAEVGELRAADGGVEDGAGEGHRTRYRRRARSSPRAVVQVVVWKGAAAEVAGGRRRRGAARRRRGRRAGGARTTV